MIALLLIAGCARYAVWFEPVSQAPFPVEVDPAVELPIGVVQTAIPHATKNDQDIDAEIDLQSADDQVLSILPTSDTGEAWGMVAKEEGETEILATVNGHDAEPVEVTVTLQP